MRFADSSSVYDLFIALLWLVALAFGIGQIAWGSYKHRQAFSQPPGEGRSDQLRLWQQLLKWQVVPPSATVPAELEEFACARDFLQSAALIGGGLAIVLASVGSAIVSLTTTGSLLSLTVGYWYFFAALLIFASLVGNSLGYSYGVWHLHRQTARTLTYGDLQPRRLADYRSVLVPWIAGLLIVYAIVLPLLLAPPLGSRAPLLLNSGAPVLVPVWIVETVPAAMLVTVVTSEIVLARLARLPRLLLTSHPQTAQRADNLLRAMTISKVYGFAIAGLCYLGFAQWFLILQFFDLLGIASQELQPPAIFLVLPWFVGLLGMWPFAHTGRLGGTISGWPWRPVRIS